MNNKEINKCFKHIHNIVEDYLENYSGVLDTRDGVSDDYIEMIQLHIRRYKLLK